MICADGLALARSTLVSLTGFHSKAKRIYGPIECNNQLYHLALHRPEVQVRAKLFVFALVGGPQCVHLCTARFVCCCTYEVHVERVVAGARSVLRISLVEGSVASVRGTRDVYLLF